MKAATLLFAILLYRPVSGISQYMDGGDQTTIGLMAEANVSGAGYHGLTPAITIGCSTYQLHFGPRIGFKQMTGGLNENELHYFFDAGYRYSFFHMNGLSLFAAIRAEYDSFRSTENWYHAYPSYNPSGGVHLADQEFNAQTVLHHRYLNTYLGAGAECILVDKLYVTAFGGAGIKTISGYTEYYNADTGEQLHEENYLLDKNGFSWIASVGVGYRL